MGMMTNNFWMKYSSLPQSKIYLPDPDKPSTSLNKSTCQLIQNFSDVLLSYLDQIKKVNGWENFVPIFGVDLKNERIKELISIGTWIYISSPWVFAIASQREYYEYVLSETLHDYNDEEYFFLLKYGKVLTSFGYYSLDNPDYSFVEKSFFNVFTCIFFCELELFKGLIMMANNPADFSETQQFFKTLISSYMNRSETDGSIFYLDVVNEYLTKSIPTALGFYVNYIDSFVTLPPLALK